MILNIIKVGNSKGLRLPKSLLDEYKIGESVEIKLKDGYIELRAVKTTRVNWREQFQKMAEDVNEEMLIDDVFGDEEI